MWLGCYEMIGYIGSVSEKVENNSVWFGCVDCQFHRMTVLTSVVELFIYMVSFFLLLLITLFYMSRFTKLMIH